MLFKTYFFILITNESKTLNISKHAINEIVYYYIKNIIKYKQYTKLSKIHELNDTPIYVRLQHLSYLINFQGPSKRPL